MTLIEILGKIRRSGGKVRIENGEVVVLAPAGTLDPEDRQVLAEHKSEIVALFGGSEEVPWWWEPELTAEENRLLDEFMEHDTLDAEGRGTEIVVMAKECEECHQRLGWVTMLGGERCLQCDRPRDLAGLARRLRERAERRTKCSTN